MKNTKKIIKKMMLMLCIMLFATMSSYAATINIDFDYIYDDTQMVNDRVDNSNLPVRVTRETVDGSTLLYEGPLGGYDNGYWKMLTLQEYLRI